MSTYANRHNHTTTGCMSESDNDDDNEQNLSSSQQNESMIYKVKDVVSKLLHPSFLFSASSDTARPKRKRPSTEENINENQNETPSITTNGHSKIDNHRQTTLDDEPQLTDDEDSNGRDVLSTKKDLIEIEQQKKRRRTANHQSIVSTTANGNHEDERPSPSLSSANSIGSLTNRRIIDNGTHTTNTTPVLIQKPIEQNHNENQNRLTSTKINFNMTSNYDPLQSPLFSISSRKTTDISILPNRTTTNLKSNINEFSNNYLLATGLADRSQMDVHESSKNSTNRLLPNERQIFGANYSSINSRRLPYIERLRRRTLQDCIRLNRTLDSEPLSISTIEEHTSAVNSPTRKPVKTAEKDCGIQCNISTVDQPMEPSRKIQRTFPPADIRNEALSIPNIEKSQSTINRIEPEIETDSSIVIEPIKPINDSTKPKVLGNITSFSWPKFARAQEEYAKKYPDKCRTDITSAQTMKSIVSVTNENSNVNSTSTTITTTTPKFPIFNASPPRPAKLVTGPIWKCPSCTLEHPAQTASCSLCHGINPNYKRLAAIDTTPSLTPSKLPDVIVEKSDVSKALTMTTTTTTTTTTESTAPNVPTPILSFQLAATKENAFSAFSTNPITSAPATSGTLTSTTAPMLFGVTPTTTKENIVLSPPTPSTVPLISRTFPTTGVTTSANSAFQFGSTTTSSYAPVSSLSSTNNSTSTTSSTASLFTITTTATTATTAPSASFSFGSFSGTSTTTAATTTTASALIPSIGDSSKTPFTFGANQSTLSSTIPNSFAFSSNPLASSASTLGTTVTTAPSTTFSTSSAAGGFSFPNPFPSVPSSSITSTLGTTATTSTPLTTFSASSGTGGFSFSSSFPSASSSAVTTTTNTATTTAPSLFGSGFAATTTSSTPSGFPFQANSTTATTTSPSTPSGFPFSTSGTTTTSSSMPSEFNFSASGPATTLTSTAGLNFSSTGTTTISGNAPFSFGASAQPKSFGPLSNSTSSPAFGTISSFGSTPKTTENTTSSISTFPTFGSTAAPSFSFGSPSNTPANSSQTPVTSTGTTGGFAFGSSATSVPPVFGSASAPFGFNSSTSFSFGSTTTTPGPSAPFQFSGSPSPAVNSTTTGGFSPSTTPNDNNPFSVTGDAPGKRPIAKAKRRAKP